MIVTQFWWSSLPLDESFDIIFEVRTNKDSVSNFEFSGPQRGKTETWIQNLPGEGEHLIRSLDKYQETYWLPVVNARNVSSPSMIDWLSDKPWIREEIMQNFTALGQKIEMLGSKWTNPNLERLGFRLKNLHFFYDEALTNDYGMVLELDANGRLLGSLHSMDGANFRLSEVVEGPTENPYERVLYIGSYVNPYILKLTIPNFTQDYQQKQKQNTPPSVKVNAAGGGENGGVDFSLLPYSVAGGRRAISVESLDTDADEENAIFVGTGANRRRLRKETARYSSSTA